MQDVAAQRPRRDIDGARPRVARDRAAAALVRHAEERGARLLQRRDLGGELPVGRARLHLQRVVAAEDRALAVLAAERGEQRGDAKVPGRGTDGHVRGQGSSCQSDRIGSWAPNLARRRQGGKERGGGEEEGEERGSREEGGGRRGRRRG